MKSPALTARLLPLSALLSVLPITAALAQTPGYPPIVDEITLTVAEEGWVETDTARVVIRLEAAGEGSEAAELRADFLDVLEDLDPDADWRFLSYDRRQDNTGLERWTARAEARLPETGLDGLADEAREASRPGLAVQVEETDFSPTLADRESTTADLRQEIYQRAGEELVRLNDAFPERDFRLAGIDFDYGEYQPMMMERAAQPMQAMDAGGGRSAAPSVAVAERVEVRARIRLSAFGEAPAASDNTDGDARNGN
ncbi:hypothetical protein [Fodinicurvata sp. EGI_FJ10296]|uniref:hypothetical protein n=1 Tax=Fodinicurvata sp. EGI_FJ10296 TaxID=3231908 RepID=UPI003452FBC7